MSRILRRPSASSDPTDDLTPAQKRMYASEKLTNFRTIAKLCATQSTYTLTSLDLASADLYVRLAEFKQFVMMSSCALSPQIVYANLGILMQSKFPLEGFDAIPGTSLVDAFLGTVADVPGIVVYRGHIEQLVVGFSSTATIKQALYDMYAIKQPYLYEKGPCIHAGFWKMYEGCRSEVLRIVHRSLQRHRVRELAIVGHSMGGALSYLFALDVLSGRCALPSGTVLTVATFGCPRIGDAALSDYWQDLVNAYQATNGKGSVKEYCVKTLNDGVPSLPSVSWGYKHLTRTPLYFHHGRLFNVPSSECEHGVFSVADDALDRTRRPEHPRGGHNYYNGVDAERVIRRIYWMAKLSKGTTGWEEAYLAKITEIEQAWQEDGGVAPRDVI